MKRTRILQGKVFNITKSKTEEIEYKVKAKGSKKSGSKKEDKA